MLLNKSELLSGAVIRFAGDSGDGVQLSGDRFAAISAIFGNTVSTLADYPAEIRAPHGTTYGVSGYQVHLSSGGIKTAGDYVDILVAMNPAALKVNLRYLRPGSLIIYDNDSFSTQTLERAGWNSDPRQGTTLSPYKLHGIDISARTKAALKDSPLNKKEVLRCKNFYTLGFVCWLLEREIKDIEPWLKTKFAKNQDLAKANNKAFQEGYLAGEIGEVLTSYTIPQNTTPKAPGHYRFISGNEGLAMGLQAAALQSDRKAFFAGYPITPASTILKMMQQSHVMTIQAEDEIAAIGAAIGASYGGRLGISASSGPGISLKGEFLGLAVITELPLVLINVQRCGPSTGMPTKSEQADLLLALWGRHGEAPLIVLAPSTPAECFDLSYRAGLLAMKYMSPVLILSDAALANSHETWKLPETQDLENLNLTPSKQLPEDSVFQPYARNENLVREWITPGTPGKEHTIGGLEKENISGRVSQDHENHALMIKLRAEKISKVQDDIPPAEVFGPKQGNVLFVAWGSSWGAIRQAVEEYSGLLTAAHLHLSYLNPLPKDLGEIFSNYQRIFIPENNSGQLLIVLRSQFPDIKFTGFSKLDGPFKVSDIKNILVNTEKIDE